MMTKNVTKIFSQYYDCNNYTSWKENQEVFLFGVKYKFLFFRLHLWIYNGYCTEKYDKYVQNIGNKSGTIICKESKRGQNLDISCRKINKMWSVRLP